MEHHLKQTPKQGVRRIVGTVQCEQQGTGGEHRPLLMVNQKRTVSAEQGLCFFFW
jgi:hypothetical protein